MPEPTQQPHGFGTGDLLPTTLLAGRYVILEKIAQGGMGAVYKAKDKRLQGTLVAVKEMSESAIQPSEREQVIECFQREAELLARLRHPNLARVTDRFQRGDRHYTVMEYVEGDTLHDVLKTRSEPFPEERVLIWADQLCDVLAFLHRQHPKIIYRDMKPGNVMVMEGTDVVKLIDFGIARFYKPGRRRDTIEFGTDGYAPPEQYGKAQTDERSDVYALGATLHQLLSLRDPVSKPFHFPPLHRLNPKVSHRVASVIDKAVEASKSERYQDMDEMRAALLEGVSLAGSPVAVGDQAGSPEDDGESSAVDFGEVGVGDAAPSRSVSIPVPAGETVQLSSDAPWLKVRPRSVKGAAAGGGSPATSVDATLTLVPEALNAGRRRLTGGWLTRWAGWHTQLLVPAPETQRARLKIEGSGGTRHHVPVSVTVVPRGWNVTLGWLVTVAALLIEVGVLLALGLLALLLW
jgi:serine/threonine-protein kinase